MGTDDEGTREHYLPLQFAINDAPFSDEIVVALGAALSGRPHHRIGNRYLDLKELGHDQKIQQLSELDLQVSYLEAGTGNPLVLVHGVGMNAEAWFPQIEVLSRFYRVIAVDMPGHGESSRFRYAATLKDYVHWLAVFLKT